MLQIIYKNVYCKQVASEVSGRELEIAMKVCSMYHLMLFVLDGSEGLQIYIHS